MLTFVIALFFGFTALLSVGVIVTCLTKGTRLAFAIQAELNEINLAWYPVEITPMPSIVPPVARLKTYRNARPAPRSNRFNLPAAQLAA